MSTFIYKLNIAVKKLEPLRRKSMTDLNRSEPYDLEEWLASCGISIFGRQVLWIARQDRPSNDQRSDIIGVDEEGNLLIVELKRGELAEDAITQALSYAAEYAAKNTDDLARLYAEQSEKDSLTALVSKAESIEDAHSRLSAHVGEDIEVNESQILVLAAEDFTPNALAICDYLNDASDQAKLLIECWQYSIFDEGNNEYLFALEQILPPSNVRRAIDEKREASKASKYARDPIRMNFMIETINYLTGKSVHASRKGGQSYICRINDDDWEKDYNLVFSVRGDHPCLILPEALKFTGDLAEYALAEGSADGKPTIEFKSVDTKTAKFDEAFGERLIEIVQSLHLAGNT